MVQTVLISTIEQLMPILSEQEFRPDLNRNRSMYLYRGMPNAAFHMTTSLRRNCKELQTQLEPSILRNFTKYGVSVDPSIGQSVWRQMILGQHHGLPTRLLDWSHSPLMALHFAVTENDMDEMGKHDCMVWRIDMSELHAMLPPAYQAEMARNSTQFFSVDMLDRVTVDLAQYDRDMGDRSMVIIEPPSIDPRIVSQYSFFSVIPGAMTDIEGFLEKNTRHTVKYVIRKELRWRVRDMLDELNISERLVYPGLDGLTRWLARHYFVKEN